MKKNIEELKRRLRRAISESKAQAERFKEDNPEYFADKLSGDLPPLRLRGRQPGELAVWEVNQLRREAEKVARNNREIRKLLNKWDEAEKMPISPHIKAMMEEFLREREKLKQALKPVVPVAIALGRISEKLDRMLKHLPEDMVEGLMKGELTPVELHYVLTSLKSVAPIKYKLNHIQKVHDLIHKKNIRPKVAFETIFNKYYGEERGYSLDGFRRQYYDAVKRGKVKRSSL